MVNKINYGNRGMPSVHWGRGNIAARYENHAMARRQASLFNCCNHSAGIPSFGSYGFPQRGAPFGAFGFGGFPTFGGWGNNNVTINTGPSNSMAAGFVVGTAAKLGIGFAPQIGNFFKGIFGKA